MRNVSETGQIVPIYHERPKKPGLYLALFHGREDPEANMDDWGFEGPILGPLKWTHTTYMGYIRLCFETLDDERQYFATTMFPDANDLQIHRDLVKYAGCYYGDWSVFVVSPEETERGPERFRDIKRTNEMSRPLHCMR